jgi:HD-like signal output (HDOD) protein
MVQQVNAVPTYSSGKRSVPADNNASPPEVRGSALEFLSALAMEVSRGTVELPCFPDVVIRIRNALADSETTPEQRVTIVGAEPRLAARLLQTANSAAFNPSGRPLTDLRTAITRLGLQLVQSAAMAFAVQQMKDAESLRSIAKPLSELWRDCIAVASISQVVARRTKVSPDEAFLTGLLHGIGRLYIMVRAVDRAKRTVDHRAFMDLVDGWHASIGKAILENWGFAEEMSDAVGSQADHGLRSRHDADLLDVLTVSVVLGDALKNPAPRAIRMQGINAFQVIGLTEQDCTTILTHAEYQLASLQDALGC